MTEQVVTHLPSNRTFITTDSDGVTYHTWFRLDGSVVSMISVDNEVVYDETKKTNKAA